MKTLTPEYSAFLEGFSQVFASIDHLPIPEQRQTIKELFKIPEDQLESIAKVENKSIKGKNGEIPLRIYTPTATATLPVMIYLHRGGWVYGSLDEAEGICRKLANELQAIVVSVDYRLSPEHKFPIPLEDCYQAVEWTIQNVASFSGNPKAVVLAGESAGGNLAAAVTLMNRDTHGHKLAGQLLIYPVLTSDLNPIHYENSPDKSLLSFENMEFFLEAYLKSPEDGENPYASPLKSLNLANLPPCFIITADHDALKHEGAAYAEAIKKADVDVQIKCYPNVIHGFLDLPLSDAEKTEAFSDIKAWFSHLTR